MSTIRRLGGILALLLTLAYTPAQVSAAEVTLNLADGSSLKVFVFRPIEDGNGPWPLAVVMSGGVANEYVARSQFWLGHELAERGWAIAVPVAPDSKAFFGETGLKIPEVIQHLQSSYSQIQSGRTLMVGISNGGSAAIEIASRNPENYFGVVAVPGLVRPGVIHGDLDLKGLPIYIRIGENDNFRWNRHLSGVSNALTEAGAEVNAALVPNERHVFRLNWNELQPWLDELGINETEAPRSMSD